MKPRLMVACDGLLEILHHGRAYVFVGSFNYFPTNILRDIYAHTYRVSYSRIKKQLRAPSHPQKGVNRNINIVYRSPLWA